MNLTLTNAPMWKRLHARNFARRKTSLRPHKAKRIHAKRRRSRGASNQRKWKKNPLKLWGLRVKEIKKLCDSGLWWLWPYDFGGPTPVMGIFCKKLGLLITFLRRVKAKPLFGGMWESDAIVDPKPHFMKNRIYTWCMDHDLIYNDILLIMIRIICQMTSNLWLRNQ